MEHCHQLAIRTLVHLNVNPEPFQNNDENGIKQELRNLIKQMDVIFRTQYTSINDIKKHIPLIANQVKEFETILLLYLFNDFCKQRGQLYASVLQQYLCKDNGKRINMLYHLLMNLGLIMSGCHHYMFKNDRHNKGKNLIFIDEATYLQNLSSPEYRFSKTNVHQCIVDTYQAQGVTNLRMARVLLIQSLELRRNVQKFCPIVAKQWTKIELEQHLKFEQCIVNIVSELTNVISLFV